MADRPAYKYSKYYGKYMGWGSWGAKRKFSPAALNYPKTKILKMLKENYVPKVVITKKSKNPKAKEFPEEWYIQDDDFFKSLDK